ncbi:MT-A70-domain-containing protein [Xylariaceae sp. FL1651]|nr:MT-A70-domain-containing protein [Xylariaceae sp. FL1651]
MESSVLFENRDKTVVIIDVPRSLEEAQVLPGQSVTRHIVSSSPVRTPWQVPEPKNARNSTKSASPSAAIAELMTLESIKSALEIARASHGGPWCLSRVTRQKQTEEFSQNSKTGAAANTVESRKRKHTLAPVDSEKNRDTTSASAENESIFIPESSHHIQGTIESQRNTFLKTAPQFDLIVLDPPWPSRSVKRKSNSYATAYDIEEARNLLSQVPVLSHLKPGGLVAVWVTNKAAVTDLLTAPGGIFAQWGVEPIGEWIWLKVTSTGEPVLNIESIWRKPWERLLIARKRGSFAPLPVSKRVIIGVPDVHSRKPNLRELFNDILPGNCQGLEVFARNLTAGWWSWGNEVLFFQHRYHWVAVEDERTH